MIGVASFCEASAPAVRAGDCGHGGRGQGGAEASAGVSMVCAHGCVPFIGAAMVPRPTW